jgi:hypothetical protein
VTGLVTRTRAVEVSPYLAIYLNDHLAGATGGVALADRAAHNAASYRHATTLRTIADEIRADRSALIELMNRLNVRPSRIKPTLALVAERLGRLKLNGHILRPSPLTPFIELESLSLGVEGKLRLWRVLSHIVDDRQLVTRLDELINRGQHSGTRWNDCGTIWPVTYCPEIERADTPTRTCVTVPVSTEPGQYVV